MDGVHKKLNMIINLFLIQEEVYYYIFSLTYKKD